MSKTIKVIDLLNKIANGEIPKRIRLKYHTYYWDKDSEAYVDEDTDFWVDNFDNKWIDALICVDNKKDLNEIVEIIEEEPEINIQSLEEIDERYPGQPPEVIAVPFRRINELIRAIKQLDKQIKEK